MMNGAMRPAALSMVLMVAFSNSAEPPASNSSELLNLLVMADIGHSRGHAWQLTSPFPMDKSANEGSFSLYEGMYDYVMNQGARPNAAIVMGDVAYGGGSIASTEATRAAFQKYLGGKVPEDRVFVAIGNHDVHYLGCTHVNPMGWCYYGAETKAIWEAAYNMTFWKWRSNWLHSFSGLTTRAIAPPRKGKDKCKCAGKDNCSGEGCPWLAPSRYNLNLDNSSSVYLIVGLRSGVGAPNWNGDTPAEAADATIEPDIECEFMRNSLEYGRSIGKTIFVYVTHDFHKSCNDWELMRQIDVWMYGHKHNYWQSPLKQEAIVQEDRYYPARFLIGNGGFDEGYIDTVNFAHVTEEPISGGDRVRLNFRVFDTCISDEDSCPDSKIPFHGACWKKCKHFPDGFDNGGGGRKAIPSHKGYGFTFEAPRKPPASPTPQRWSGSWKMQVSKGNDTNAWLALGPCPWSLHSYSSECLSTTDDEAAATKFEFYAVREQDKGNVLLRVAVDDDVRAPLMVHDSLLYRPSEGFWHAENGIGTMQPTHGYSLEFAPQLGPNNGWQILNVGWTKVRKKVFKADALEVKPGHSLDVVFKRPAAKPEELIV